MAVKKNNPTKAQPNNENHTKTCKNIAFHFINTINQNNKQQLPTKSNRTLTKIARTLKKHQSNQSATTQ